MRRSVARLTGFLALAAGLAFIPGVASATLYTDPLADNYGGPEVDINSVSVTNDASNIYFQINLNPAASIGPSANRYGNYEIGIQSGPGGQTLINGTFGTAPADGNPYGNAVGISTGENYFIGAFLAGTSFSGGAQLYSFNSGTGWSQVGSNATLNQTNTVTPELDFAFPLSALGLSGGSSFNFDVWTTFGSPQAAYDALDNVGTGSANAPYNAGTTYDSATATGSTFGSTSYTVTVPEPASLGLLCLSGLALGARRRSR
jgi:hypothetical protein